MRKSVSRICFALLLAPAFVACESPQYVDNGNTRYLNANDVSTDMLPSVPYTKSGQYLINPDDAVNTRDNRGMRPQGYGHDVNDDVVTPPPSAAIGAGTATTTTTVYHNAPSSAYGPGGYEPGGAE